MEYLEEQNMSHEDEDEIRLQIDQTIEELLHLGFIDVVGINQHGQWLYKATEKGKEFYGLAKRNGMVDFMREFDDDE